ncbi:hypothetical protein CDAR_31931 [Caerostris darwini]|uniref:Uncharacterized protein n=1 Tax=Caerostris darwini TaxID=1538125 RepID=A0AAV4RN52_9ARAC|nr:hypothetical protein CDAR_31931 [Caerostris darwini]
MICEVAGLSNARASLASYHKAQGRPSGEGDVISFRYEISLYLSYHGPDTRQLQPSRDGNDLEKPEDKKQNPSDVNSPEPSSRQKVDPPTGNLHIVQLDSR